MAIGFLSNQGESLNSAHGFNGLTGFAMLAPGFSGGDDLVKELQNHVKNVTAPYKYPRKIDFVDVLPKTVSGKIRRIELRDQEWGQE